MRSARRSARSESSTVCAKSERNGPRPMIPPHTHTHRALSLSLSLSLSLPTSAAAACSIVRSVSIFSSHVRHVHSFRFPLTRHHHQSNNHLHARGLSRVGGSLNWLQLLDPNRELKLGISFNCNNYSSSRLSPAGFILFNTEKVTFGPRFNLVLVFLSFLYHSCNFFFLSLSPKPKYHTYHPIAFRLSGSRGHLLSPHSGTCRADAP